MKLTTHHSPLTTDLSVNIAGIKMKNPVMCGSGTFAFGEEYAEFFDLKEMGAIVTKTITLKPRKGNPPPRIKETYSGMLNCIGLQNPGTEAFIRDKMPVLRKPGIPIIVSIGGETEQEYTDITRELKGVRGVSGIELNISCPNLHPHLSPLPSRERKEKERLRMFAQDEKAAAGVVRRVRRITRLPLIVKLSPNVTDIKIIARAVERAGADAVSLINTPLGMAINLEKRTPCLSNTTGGLSGPAIKPIALRMVREVYNTVRIPIIGMGGIMDARDALEFMVCGAKAVAVGTANFVNPRAIPEIIDGIRKYMVENRIKKIGLLVGSLKAK